MCTFKHPFPHPENDMKADPSKIWDMKLKVNLDDLPYDGKLKEYLEQFLIKDERWRPYIHDIIENIHNDFIEHVMSFANIDSEMRTKMSDFKVLHEL